MWVKVVNTVLKKFKGGVTMVPQTKDVVDVTTPKEGRWLKVGHLGFPEGEVNGGEGTTKRASHRGALKLHKLGVVESEAVVG